MNKNGSTLASVIVSFTLMLTVVTIFAKMISTASGLAARASERTRAYEEAYSAVFTSESYRPKAEISFSFGDDFRGEYSGGAISGSTAAAECYCQYAYAEGGGITASVYRFCPDARPADKQ